jgi:HD superfamily phosphohydrolase
MINEDGVHAVEQFVLAKYYMTANVYRHRVRLVTDLMIGRAIRLGIEVDCLATMQSLYQFDGTPAFVANYQRWDDARFLETYCPRADLPPGAKSGAMLKRFRERKLLKEIFRDSIGQPYDARSWETLKGLHKRKSDALAKAVEHLVADYLNQQLELVGERRIDPDFVMAHSFGIKSARESSKNDEEGILVNVRPAPQPFTDVSTLFRSINEAYSDNFVVIYAPIEWPVGRAKDDLRASWKEPIRQLIQREWGRSRA